MGVQRRRPPAYAKPLIVKRCHGLAPSRDLLIACDWDVGKSWAWRIVVPPYDCLSEFDFRIAAGLSCLVLGRDEERMHDVARAVSACKPLRLIAVHLDGTRIHVYRAYPPGGIPALSQHEHAA